MAEPTIPVPVTALIALAQVLVQAEAQLAAGSGELRRLAEEEFVSVRFRIPPQTAGDVRAAVVVVQGLLREAPPGASGTVPVV